MAGAYIPAVQTDCVIDLSHSNDIPTPLDAFRQAAASGVALVIHKATQGVSFSDNTYAARRVAAQSAGLLWGAYHFCDGSDPVAQIKHFLAVVGDPTGVLLALDAEKNASQVSVAQVAAMVTCLQTQTGRFPLLYMGASGPDGNGIAANPTLSQCPLWLPEYGNKPICPPGFDKWVLHQYTGDGINGSGYVAGIGRGLDRSYFAGAVDQLKAWHAAMCAGITPSQVIVVQPPPPTQPGAPVDTSTRFPPLTNPMQPPANPAPPVSVLPDLKAAQAELGVAADGYWGPITAAAFAQHYGG